MDGTLLPIVPQSVKVFPKNSCIRVDGVFRQSDYIVGRAIPLARIAKKKGMFAMTLNDLISAVWTNNEITVPEVEAKAFVKDETLDCEGIVVRHNADGTVTFSRNNTAPAPAPVGHTYIQPEFTNKVKACIKHGCNILLTGPLGTGKTEFVYEMAKDCGFAKVFQVNGSESLTTMDFHGTMAVDIDKATGQSYTHFDKGALYRAFIEGTELDKDGNQVLDKDGNPIVIGKPAIFFLDEFAAVLPEVFLGVFNRALEIPRNGGSRSIEIPGDKGRVVKSHPGFVMFLAGNNVGIGNTGSFELNYTAQNNRMDESTLNRLNVVFRFGYNRKAEQGIVIGMLNDDLEADNILKFRDDMRALFRAGNKTERLFSTRTLVSICRQARIYREGNIAGWMVEAIKDTVFNGLGENDKPAWNEEIRMIWGRDLMQEDAKANREYDYF